MNITLKDVLTESKKVTRKVESVDAREILSDEHQDMIKKIIEKQKLFGSNAPDILDSYVDGTDFVVSLDNSNPVYIADLESDLYKLEDEYNIGYEKEANGEGFYAYNYIFFYYDDESDNEVVAESINIGENTSKDDTYTYHNFTYNGQRYSFTECSADYKAAGCRNKDYIKGIYPYDNADHPWAVSEHNDTMWKIVKAGKVIDNIGSDALEPVVKLLQKYDADVEPMIDKR